jgi:alkylhydroperoxidase family enzyme
LQGGTDELVDAVAQGKRDSPAIDEKHRNLLHYVEKLTLKPADVRDTDVQKLRDGGWKDEEIFEASFITSLFAFFNRMADAYGLDYPSGGYFPPEARPQPVK